MLTAKNLKEQLSENDIFNLLRKMGGEPIVSSKGVITSKTICHRGDKHKLEYYPDSGFFHCYTDCGDSFDIIELVIRVKKLNFNNAINYIALQVGISTLKHGFGEEVGKINDWDFIEETNPEAVVKRELKGYGRNVLNIFQEAYFQEWIDEGISVETMKKFGISYSALHQKIIIPHYDLEGKLVGIRGRALLEEDIEKGKYTPYCDGKTIYSHPLSLNLYGIDKNKEAIMKLESIMLVEGEKSVMQADTMFGKDNITVALCGSNLSNQQRDMILELGVKNVYIALDKQYKESDDEEAKRWATHIRKRMINKLAQFCNVYIIWDTEGLIGYKESPTDRGKDIFLKLLDKKIFATSASIMGEK